VAPEAIAAVEAIVKENRQVMVNEIDAHLDMSHGSAHHIIRDVLQFHKYLIFNKLINIYGFHLTRPHTYVYFIMCEVTGNTNYNNPFQIPGHSCIIMNLLEYTLFTHVNICDNDEHGWDTTFCLQFSGHDTT
jgi:hypothetical protein